MKALIGRKMGMTEVFAEDGTMYPVSVIEVLPNIVSQVKVKEKDGYDALQVGFDVVKENRVNKPDMGHFKKVGVAPMKNVYEVKGDELLGHQVGDKLTADLFKAGELVDVIGVSKGRGFSGTVKRYGHHIGPKGHGSGYHRGSGSFAHNGRNNGRILPGKKMPGHHGNLQATIQNLLVVEVNSAENYILVKGGIPGPKKGIVTIRSAIKTALHAPEVVKPLVDLKKKEASETSGKAAE